MQIEPTTEQKIKDAARSVFIKKGFAGARMQDIADEAGINKALLHYYYRSKEKLFEVIFDEVFGAIVPAVNAIIAGVGSVEEKLDAFVDQYITVIEANPYVPLFIIHELSQNPERFVTKIKNRAELPNISLLVTQLFDEISKGNMRFYNPFHLIMNILAMCAFPFVAKPMLKAVTGMSEEMWQGMMKDRREEVKRFVRQALRP